MMTVGRVIFVTSFKGGVGKTTVCANLAYILALMNKKVLIIDGDIGMRCLDMALGLESFSLYDICDCLNGVCSAEEAITVCERNENLSFIPSPMSKPDSIPDTDSFIRTMKELREKYDYVFIDSCAEETAYYLSFAAASDEAIVVSSHQSISIRAAEKTGLHLENMGFRNVRLIINNYHPELVKSKSLPSVLTAVNGAYIQLIGVIPYDTALIEDQEKGLTAFSLRTKNASKYEIAFLNTARRINGENVPLFDEVENIRRRKYFFKHYLSFK